MQVTLDEETWVVSDDTPVLEVLAEVSDRAQARGRMVITLTAGERALTDRDLSPSFLAQPVGTVGSIRATSTTIGDLIHKAEPTARQYANWLAEAGRAVVEGCRCGETRLAGLDQWLGQLADYLDWRATVRALRGEESPDPCMDLAAALLAAREQGDLVRVADLIEYELIPKLAA
jgi:hypothetical protein